MIWLIVGLMVAFGGYGVFCFACWFSRHRRDKRIKAHHARQIQGSLPDDASNRSAVLRLILEMETCRRSSLESPVFGDFPTRLFEGQSGASRILVVERADCDLAQLRCAGAALRGWAIDAAGIAAVPQDALEQPAALGAEWRQMTEIHLVPGGAVINYNDGSSKRTFCRYKLRGRGSGREGGILSRDREDLHLQLIEVKTG